MSTWDCLHRPSSDRVSWTTGNVGEAIPGVQTPLSYTFWTRPFERTVRGSYAEMGVLPRSAAWAPPTDVDEAALGVFFGRPVLNTNLVLEVGAALPGVSSRDVAANVLGATDLAYLPPDRPGRYPVVAVKLPALAARLGRRMARLDREVHRAWRCAVTGTDPGRTRAGLPAIRDLFTRALLDHSHATFLSQAVFEQLTAAAGGRVGGLGELVSGYGGMLEVRLLQELWDVAQGRADLDGWLARYGYLGPNAGSLSARSWRERPAPVERLLGTYRSAPAPAEVEARRGEVRQRAERALLDGLSPPARVRLRVLLRLARHFIPLREVGKNMYLKAGDAARVSIRRLGAELARTGALTDPEDVFFLTWDELVGALPPDVPAVLEERRARYLVYRELELPPVFTGTPEPRTRRMPLFVGAAAVVIDVGGQLSHGAIVARELGIPCVAGVRTATATLRTGDRIVVDGDRGTVTRLDPRPAHERPETRAVDRGTKPTMSTSPEARRRMTDKIEMDATTMRAAMWSGVLFVVFLIVAQGLLMQFVPGPSPDLSAQEVADRFIERKTEIRIGSVIQIIVWTFWATWASGIIILLRRMERGYPVITYSAIALNGASVCIIVLIPMTWAVAAFRPESIDPQLTRAMNDWVWFLWLYTWPPFAVFMALIGVAIMRNRSEFEYYPRWVAYYNFWSAIFIFPAALIAFFKTGPFAWDGIFAFWLPVIVLFGWMLVMSFVTMQSINRHERELTALLDKGPAETATA